MKQRIASISAIIATVIMSSVFVSAKQITIGVTAGVNFANVYVVDTRNTVYIIGEQYDTPEEEINLIMGFCGGSFLTYRFDENFAVQLEILFAMKGMHWQTEERSWDGIPYEVDHKWTLTYLEVPVLAKLRLPIKGRIKPDLLFGTALSKKLSARYWFEGEGSLNFSTVRESGEGELEDINNIDLGLVVGSEFYFDYNRLRFLLDIRYTKGLTRIRDQEEISEKNGVFSMMLGFSF